MNGTLRQKMLQDMKQNKWQFISVMIMAFLGVFIFTGNANSLKEVLL